MGYTVARLERCGTLTRVCVCTQRKNNSLSIFTLLIKKLDTFLHTTSQCQISGAQFKSFHVWLCTVHRRKFKFFRSKFSIGTVQLNRS